MVILTSVRVGSGTGWPRSSFFCFFFNVTATTEIYTLSLHDALPICAPRFVASTERSELLGVRLVQSGLASELEVNAALAFASERNLRLGEVLVTRGALRPMTDRKSTRLNSSH